ncbi:MAG: hypothetical protein NZ576_06685 [Bacteroidia bacterium]|nr:hypothetical protein [Bacteroidia bacterium]
MQAKRKVDELQEFLAHPLVGRLVVNYLSCVIREEQLKISWNIIANYLGCLPSEVVLVCYAFLDNLNLSDKELHQLKKQWELEKFRQAKMFNIGYDVTPAAIMESLIAQYIQLKQK